MSLSEQINDDLKTAMKSKDSFTLGVIRMLKGAIQMAKTNVHDDISDDSVIDVVAKQIVVLEKYLPAQLSKEEVLEIVEEAFEKVNPSSQKEMGLIMKEVTPKLKGRADMRQVSQIIKDKLVNL